MERRLHSNSNNWCIDAFHHSSTLGHNNIEKTQEEILVNIDMTLEVFEYLKQDLKLISELVTSFSYLSDLSARRHNSMLQENMRNDCQ